MAASGAERKLDSNRVSTQRYEGLEPSPSLAKVHRMWKVCKQHQMKDESRRSRRWNELNDEEGLSECIVSIETNDQEEGTYVTEADAITFLSVVLWPVSVRVQQHDTLAATVIEHAVETASPRSRARCTHAGAGRCVTLFARYIRECPRALCSPQCRDIPVFSCMCTLTF